ncbi:MAG: copper resistance protein CopD [Gordonia sp.]|uniref:copper resistance D family protein n=1 Tax=Williamsia sp. 1138 TaxID=1903117 RepID=UPI000A0FD084|nr:CopD family protein [Williamsia sp. 1138]MBA4021443.1 copper resistance protein CopD [Gordonia sp. (in: high G+C Gram-positive bacteria)]OZG30634.1 copper resistance protein CopD [Williamsia sp. 1138]
MRAAGTTHRGWLIGAVPAAWLGVALCWVIARPGGPEMDAAAGAVAICAAITVLGLTSLRVLGGEPTEPRALQLIAIVAGVWFVAALVAAWLGVAERTGRSPGAVGLSDFVRVSGATPALIGTGCALLVAMFAVVWMFRPAMAVPEAAAAVTALGLLIGPVTGHLGQQTGGPVLVAVHVLAAGWWCGALAALALTVRGRKGWATSLPLFSGYAQWCVLVLFVTGVVAAFLELDSLGELTGTGYGRVLLAKSAGLAILIVVAFRQRTTWLPAARAHRIGEEVSLQRALVEVTLMAVVIGLAAGLGTTAPN